MQKRIAKLNFEKHLSVDLADQPMSVFVDSDTGVVFLNEGRGEGRMSGVVLTPDRSPAFSVRSDSQGGVLMMGYKGGRKRDMGVSGDLPGLVRWTNSANQILQNRMGYEKN